MSEKIDTYAIKPVGVRHDLTNDMFVFQPLIVLAAASFAIAGDTVPILSGCSDGADTIGTVRSDDPVKVRYSLGGGSQICYAVAAASAGKDVEGFMLGESHPSIAAFEREARSHIPEAPPPPQPAPVAKADKAEENTPAPPPGPTSFAGFKAMDVQGRQVDLDRIPAKYVVLYFSALGNKRAVRDSEGMEAVYGAYHPKGVGVIGVGVGLTAAAVKAYAREVEATWPLIHDTGGISARYNVNPATPFYILDRERNVVAAVKRANDLPPLLDRLRRQQ
jgi:hypothetical protein